jgi:NAD(P)-dependent dehydrogenase (short-subunit alcohol dehydrogenase family)
MIAEQSRRYTQLSTEAAMSRCLGKSGVVTGTSGGLGRATVLALAADGANVLAVSRSLDGLQETAELAQRSDGSVLAVRRRRWCLDSSHAM